MTPFDRYKNAYEKIALTEEKPGRHLKDLYQRANESIAAEGKEAFRARELRHYPKTFEIVSDEQHQREIAETREDSHFIAYRKARSEVIKAIKAGGPTYDAMEKAKIAGERLASTPEGLDQAKGARMGEELDALTIGARGVLTDEQSKDPIAALVATADSRKVATRQGHMTAEMAGRLDKQEKALADAIASNADLEEQAQKAGLGARLEKIRNPKAKAREKASPGIAIN